MDLSFIGDLVTGGIGGTLLGFLGSGVSAIASYKTQKLKGDQDLAILNAESQNMIAEVNANIKRDEIKTEGEIAILETKAFETAIKMEGKDLFKESYMSLLPKNKFGDIVVCLIAMGTALIDMLRKSIRPVLTIYLVGCTTWVTKLAYDTVELAGLSTLSATVAQDLFQSIVLSIICMTSTCVSFYLGDRRLGKIVDKHLNKG